MKLNSNSVVKNSFWATYGAIATRILALLSNLFLARLLLPSEFGVIGVAYIFWSFVNLFAQNASNSFIVYKGLEDRRYVDTAYTVSIGIGLFLALGLVAISPLAANYFGVPNLVWILMVFAFNFFLSSLNSVYEGVLRRRMQYKELANSNLIASMMRVFSTVGCALMGLSYWSFVIGDAVHWLSANFLLRRHTNYDFRLRIDPEVRREVLSYNLGSTGFSLGYYVNANCDNFAVGKILGTTSLGYYNFAYQLTMALSVIFGQVMEQVGMSVFAQMSDDDRREKALAKVVEQVAFLATPVYALFFLVVDEKLISFVFGAKWLPSLAVIPWLLIFAYFRLINSQLFSMLSAIGKTGLNARTTIAIAPIAVVAFIIGANQGQIIGVGIAVAIVLGIIWTIYSWWSSCRVMNWSWKKFLILIFKPPLIALIPILVSVNALEIIQPILFIIMYLISVRIFAAKQFLNYRSLIGEIKQRLEKKWNSKYR
ncbi:MAG: lipopolysaccharide biosynthesis protein [Rivularia sp. (in: cyanobacteria)]